ncbi:MAG TPA: hypothetical protein DD670_15990 [Planctomycetaceae bacterium]|nr:hypothetical protein [Planctomycetaceae bacterium]
MLIVKSILKLAAVWYVFAVVISPNAFSLDNLLTNGDFEDLTDWGVPGDETLPAGWTHQTGTTTSLRKNPAAMQTGTNAIGGSGTSAYMPAYPSSDDTIRRDMWNVVDAVGPEWVLQYDFACEDPGAYGTRSLTAAVELSNANRINHRVTDVNDDGIGDLEVYIGTWQLVLSNAVQFDADVSTTPVVNHIMFTGRSYLTNPVYDVTITNGLGTFTATDVGYYQYPLSGTGAKPVTGAEGCNFNTFLAPAVGVGDYLVDNVVLAEIEPNRPDQYIVNGDFENTTGWGAPGTTYPPYGWTMEGVRANAAEQWSGSLAIGGSGTSAYMGAYETTVEAERRESRQMFSVPTSTDWQLDLDLAAESTFFTGQRSFTLELVGYDGGKLFLRVVDHDENGVGDIELYSNSSWQTVAGLENAIVVDDLLGENASVNHLTITGRYAEDTPFYDVIVTDANDVEFSATDLSFWAGSAPSGDFGGLLGVAFNTFNSARSYVIDNVSLIDIDPVEMIPGDTNGDNRVDEEDAKVLAANWGAPGAGPANGDFNGDGLVNALDASILAAQWTGSLHETAGGTPVPEPSTIVLCVMAALVCLGGRRRL